MIRIAIDLDEFFGPVLGGGGQGRVISNLVKELAVIDQVNQYTLFSVRKMTELPQNLKNLPPNFRLVQISTLKPQLLFLLWHTLRWPPIEWFIGEQDIIHATTTGIVPACRKARSTEAHEGRLILTVYDLVWWRFPQGLNRWGRFFHRSGLFIGAREATWLATISESTRQEVLACLPGKINPSKVKTVLIADDSAFKPIDSQSKIQAVCQKYNLPNSYIINIGTLEPRKNLPRLLQAYAALPPDLRAEYHLVIVGGYGWKVPTMQSLIVALGLEKQVTWTGYLSDEEMNILLSGATLFVYPSLYEGFGLPILEAMKCDVPIITSNVSSMPEVVGEAALLVDPTSVEELSTAMSQLLRRPELRQHLIEKGRYQRSQFSYRRMAEEMLELYENCH